MPGHPITDRQAELYMRYRSQHSQEIAAAKAGISVRSARTLDHDPTPPSQRRRPRNWRTRKDPLAGLWDETIVPMLQANSGLKPVTIFEELQETLGLDRVPDAVRRTLERRVRHWQALHGPGQDVFFPQVHPPGLRALSDFTYAAELGVTIAGQPFDHRLYHFRLACSGWEHVEVVLGGESFTALACGLQNALWRLGGAPREHRTDSLAAAFRNLTRDQQEDLTARYEALCRHYGMTATRNNLGEAHENGSVESANNHLKRRLDQALKRQGTRDFPTLDAYRAFVARIIDRHNARRATRVQAERAALAPLPARRTTDFAETTAVVTRNATIAVDKVLYSVPTRLIGQRLRIHLYDDRLEAFLGFDPVFQTPRRRASGNQRAHAIDYRHVVDGLRKKPQAFRHLTYRDALFPRDEYRRTWEALDAALPERQACKVMVGLLHLAARGACEAELARQLAGILDQGDLPDLEALRAAFTPAPADPVVVTIVPANPSDYDALLPGLAATAGQPEAIHTEIQP
jgi:hypothetical protein